MEEQSRAGCWAAFLGGEASAPRLPQGCQPSAAGEEVPSHNVCAREWPGPQPVLVCPGMPNAQDSSAATGQAATDSLYSTA